MIKLEENLRNGQNSPIWWVEKYGENTLTQLVPTKKKKKKKSADLPNLS